MECGIHQVEAGSCLGMMEDSCLGVVGDIHLREVDSCLGVLESSQLEEEVQLHLPLAMDTGAWHLPGFDYS
jgi:hypothetical protein